MRALNVLLLLVNLALFGLVAYFLFSRGFVASTGWTSVELVTIVLTALAVLITTLGIFVPRLRFGGTLG